MLQGPEILLIILIIVVIFGMGKLPKISEGLARLRLNFEKGVAEDYIEVSPDSEEVSDEALEEEDVGDEKESS